MVLDVFPVGGAMTEYLTHVLLFFAASMVGYYAASWWRHR
jgi:hypothetical protein